MSEAMSKVEIEDVLSSIRRLVSEDSKTSIVRGGPALDRRDMTLGPERLLLTPALRVITEDQPPELSDEFDVDLSADVLTDLSPETDPSPVADLAPANTADPAAPPAPIGALVAGLGAAVDAQAEQWESETGDEPPPLPEGVAALEDAEWEGDDGPILTFAAYPRVQLTNPILPVRPAPLAVSGPIAAREAPVAPVPVAPVPAAPAPVAESAAQDILSDPWTALAQPEIIEESPAETDADFAPDDVAGWAQDGEDEAQDTLRHDTATIEPDLAWADAAEAEAVQELAGQITDRLDPAEAEAMGEEALRDMVREMIVEELQGALGQRITRNIRKLVRAEIARAMATEHLH